MNRKNIILVFSVVILVIMHSVGLFGMVYGDRNYYVNLTGLNLCITAACFLLNANKPFQPYLIAFFLLAIFGYLIEVIGVKSQMIFGIYAYGNRMGPELLDAPLTIGLNWAVLILTCAALVNKMYTHILAKALAGATLMVLLDIVIEPIAMKLGYWQWDTKQIPLQNYFAWWIISFVLLLAVFKWLRNIENKSGIWVYSIQIIFFSLLHLLL